MVSWPWGACLEEYLADAFRLVNAIVAVDISVLIG